MMASGRNFDRISTPFSDAVIGNVLTRSSGPNCYVTKSSCNTAVGSSLQQQPLYNPSSNTTLPPLRNYSSLSQSTTSTAAMTERFLTTKLQNHAIPIPPARSFSLPPNVQSSSYSQTSSGFAPSDSPERTVSASVATMSMNRAGNVATKHQRKCWANMKSETCREQCRTNQARYRQKQREYVSKLEATVAQLREEIPMLEVQRRRFRYDSRQRVWDVVVEYFQLFRHGVEGDGFEQGLTHTSDFFRATEAQQQVMFLRSTMAPNIKFGNARGVAVFMTYWRQMSEYHEDLHFKLTHMEKVSESIVIATAILSVTITKTTLEFVFPHLMRSNNVEDLSLAVRLLGHKVDYPCSVMFVWDEETSLVIRMETDIDMTSPFLKILRNLKDTSRVIEGAVMAPASSLKLY